MPNLDLGHAAHYQAISQIKSGSPRVANRQFWAVGCSVTVGVGVALDQTWKECVSCTLNLPYTDLCAEGSSILWQSDQICQSQIRQDDLVLWALTTQPRLPVIRNNQLFHLTPGEYKLHAEINQEFPIDLLLSTTLVYHNIQAVRRAENFCQAVGARLIVLSVIYDVEQADQLYKIREFHQVCRGPKTWIDLGTDNMHPGPAQHKIFAENFLKIIAQ
jgi:hypothetical protein